MALDRCHEAHDNCHRVHDAHHGVYDNHLHEVHCALQLEGNPPVIDNEIIYIILK